MFLDKTTLLELQDYINHLDEENLLKASTYEDITKAINKKLDELKKAK